MKGIDYNRGGYTLSHLRVNIQNNGIEHDLLPADVRDRDNDTVWAKWEGR